MKIIDLTTDQLKLKKAAMEAAIEDRQKAATHTKFEKRALPSVGKQFLQQYNEVCNELKGR